MRILHILFYVTIYNEIFNIDRIKQMGEDLVRNFEGQGMDCKV